MTGLPHISPMQGMRFEAPEKKSAPGLLGNGLMPFFLVAVVLICYGLVVCWSACLVDRDFNFSRQYLGVLLGLICMVAVWRFDYRKLGNMVLPLYIITIALILSPFLPGIGVEENGARSWIRVGMQFQPGEFAKITMVLLSASLVSRYEGQLDDLRQYVKVVFILLTPTIAIMLQPDLGTGLVYFFIAGVTLVMGGAKPSYLIATVVAGIAAVALLLGIDEMVFKHEDPTTSTGYEYKILKQYQRSRLTVFLNPEGDTSATGYNLAQALIAVGSGGLFGKGLGNTTQAANGFLPEAPTDFIFCVLAEQLGFVGALALILLYAAFIFCAVRIALRSDDLFGMLVVCGVVGMWLFQILENIGMTIGLMPITGIPLPFFSYGSSFMVTNMIMIGLIASVASHHASLGGKRL